MEYKDEKSEVVYNLIADYTYLKSLDKGLIGAFVFSYFDSTNNFDIICFYDNEEVTAHIEGNTQVGENIIQLVSFNKSVVTTFKDDIANSFILFEKDEVLSDIKRTNTDKDFKLYTNILKLDYTKLSSKLDERFSDKSKNNYLNIYYTLVDLYYNLIISYAEKNIFDYANFEEGMNMLLDNRLVLKDEEKLHESAILEAIALAEEHTLNENKQLKMVKNDSI